MFTEQELRLLRSLLDVAWTRGGVTSESAAMGMIQLRAKLDALLGAKENGKEAKNYDHGNSGPANGEQKKHANKSRRISRKSVKTF